MYSGKKGHKKQTREGLFCVGADEGNRTLDRSLGSCCFAIKLHPHILFSTIYYTTGGVQDASIIISAFVVY